MQGIYRVQGQLAITRAIGDTELKPYITSEPEIVSFQLEGDEDFIIMASDGLWDEVSNDQAASEVYNRLKEDPSESWILGKWNHFNWWIRIRIVG